jgi:hypothetical protein
MKYYKLEITYIFTLNKDNNNNNHKKNITIFNPINLLKILLFYAAVLTLQEATLFKDGNITVHSFFR